MTRDPVHQTCLPAALALSGNDRMMTIAIKRAAFGVGHRTVKLKINSYSTTVPDCDIYLSFAFFFAQLVPMSLVIVCWPCQVVIYSLFSSRLAWQDSNLTGSARYRAIQAPQDECCAGISHTLHCVMTDERSRLRWRSFQLMRNVLLRCIKHTCWLRVVAEMVGTVHGSVGPRRLTMLNHSDKPCSNT